jgi:hypothetical protein
MRMTDSDSPGTYDPPRVEDLGTIEDLTAGPSGSGSKEGIKT